MVCFMIPTTILSGAMDQLRMVRMFKLTAIHSALFPYHSANCLKNPVAGVSCLRPIQAKEWLPLWHPSGSFLAHILLDQVAN